MKQQALVAAATVALSGCSAGYMLAEYSKVAVSQVTVACGQRYTAYRRSDNKVIILAYPIAELTHCDRAPSALHVRYGSAAAAYAEQLTPPCRVIGGQGIRKNGYKDFDYRTE